jgi:AcrR family transcriptional regulator
MSSMGRPITVSDEEIFAATARAVTKAGPARLTLADVAREVSLSPAALVKRFGSKRDLLLAFVQSAPDSAKECFVRMRAAHASPIAALIAAASSVADHVRSAEELANSLAFLQMDLSDTDFRRAALTNAQQIIAGYEALIRDAVRAGELVPCDARQVARTLQAVAGGSMINWAILREGRVHAFVRRDVETFINLLRREPEVVKGRRRRGRQPPSKDAPSKSQSLRQPTRTLDAAAAR